MIAALLLVACAPRLPPVPSTYAKACFRVYHEVTPLLGQAEVHMCGDGGDRYWLEHSVPMRPRIVRRVPCDPEQGEVCSRELPRAQRRAR